MRTKHFPHPGQTCQINAVPDLCCIVIPEVGRVSWQSIRSCCQYSCSCTWALMAMPGVWFRYSSLSVWWDLVHFTSVTQSDTLLPDACQAEPQHISYRPKSLWHLA